MRYWMVGILSITTVLFFGLLYWWDSGFLPFTNAYRPKFWWPVLLVFCGLYLCLTYVIVLLNPGNLQRSRKSLIYLHVLLLGLSACIYTVYHGLHSGQRKLFMYQSLEIVTPYHIQMAKVWFPTMLVVLVMLLIGGFGTSGRKKEM